MSKSKYTDYSDLDRVVIKTLKKIRKSMIKGAYLVDNSRNIELISTAIKLLNRYHNDYYEDELQMFIKAEYKLIKAGDNNLSRVERTIIYNNLKDYFSLHKNKFKKCSIADLEYEDAEYITAIHICEGLRNQSRNLAYLIIQRYGPGWWV
jgi:hypothetical protein